jgi:hypothetical protein
MRVGGGRGGVVVTVVALEVASGFATGSAVELELAVVDKSETASASESESASVFVPEHMKIQVLPAIFGTPALDHTRA